MAKALLTSFSLHAAALGLMVWLAPQGQPMPSEKPQLIELQPLALLPSPPLAPAAPPVEVTPPPEPHIVPEPPQAIADLPPLPEPPPPEPVPEPPPEVTPPDLIRSVAAPLDPLPPPPKPKPVAKPRPVVAKSPPALPKAPQEIVPASHPAADPTPAAPSLAPPQVSEPASVIAAAPTGALMPDSAYLGKLSAWLARHKPDPARVMRGQRQGTVIIMFVLDREGRVVSKAVEKSSGIDALDKAALEMVDRANPLPPLPVSFVGDQFALTIPVQFQLQ